MKTRAPVALITGASRGLGRYSALAFAEAGYRVAICGRIEQDIQEVVRDITDVGGWARAWTLDVRDAAGVKACVDEVVDECGAIDVLINNAGLTSTYLPFHEWTLEEIDETIDTNLKGTLYACHAVLPIMMARRSGHILNVASDLGRRPLPRMAPYVAAKHAVVGFSGSLYKEARDHNVKVTVVLPGVIDTFFADMKPGQRDPHQAMPPEHVASALLQIVRQPGNLTIDEITLHPLGQDF